MLNVRSLSLTIQCNYFTETHPSLVKSKDLAVMLPTMNEERKIFQCDYLLLLLDNYFLIYNIKRQYNLRPNKQILIDLKFTKVKT